MMTNETNQAIIERLAEYSDRDAAEIGLLLPHLNSEYSDKPIDKSWLEEVIASPYHDQIVARLDGKIVGTATLNTLFEPQQGKIGYLESFVVDSTIQGHGIGSLIWQEIDAWCREKGVRLEFTSSPAREAAHRFYLHHGAATRETTVFRYTPQD